MSGIPHRLGPGDPPPIVESNGTSSRLGKQATLRCPVFSIKPGIIRQRFHLGLALIREDVVPCQQIKRWLHFYATHGGHRMCQRRMGASKPLPKLRRMPVSPHA